MANDNKKLANSTLTEAFSEVGKKYGYDNVSAEYCSLRDFRVKWQRTYRWAEFKVSDYMMGASRETLTGLAETLFSKISGKETTYTDEMRNYVLADDFSKTYQPLYLARSKKITKSPVGEHKNLADAMGRLVADGYVKDTDGIYLTWTKEDLSSIGYSSSLMKVIVISSKFDDETVPDYVIDFILYHEYLTANLYKQHFGNPGAVDVETVEKEFKQYNDAIVWLNQKGIYL